MMAVKRACDFSSRMRRGGRIGEGGGEGGREGGRDCEVVEDEGEMRL